MTVKALAELTLESAFDSNIEMRDLLIAMADLARSDAALAKRYPRDYERDHIEWMDCTVHHLDLATQFDPRAWPKNTQVQISFGSPEHHETTLWYSTLAQAARAALKGARERAEAPCNA